jgi:hypothetical protein
MLPKTIFVVVLAVLSSLAQSSPAQTTIEEYTAAANKEGCLAIPYSNWREKCITYQSDVKLWCDGKGRRTCDESGLRSDSILEKIRNLDIGIRERTSQNKPDEVRELQNKKQTAENELAAARKEVERRRDITQQCIQQRVLVQTVFDSAVGRVESERSDSSKTAIHPTLDKIKRTLLDGKGDHETQIREARKSEEECKKQL